MSLYTIGDQNVGLHLPCAQTSQNVPLNTDKINDYTVEKHSILSDKMIVAGENVEPSHASDSDATLAHTKCIIRRQPKAPPTSIVGIGSCKYSDVSTITGQNVHIPCFNCKLSALLDRVHTDDPLLHSARKTIVEKAISALCS